MYRECWEQRDLGLVEKSFRQLLNSASRLKINSKILKREILMKWISYLNIIFLKLGILNFVLFMDIKYCHGETLKHLGIFLENLILMS